MKHIKLSLFLLILSACAMSGCKIQDIAGPYEPAPSRKTIEELAVAEDTRDEVIPMPEQVIRKTEQEDPVEQEEFVPVPVQPKPVVETVKEETKVEVKVEVKDIVEQPKVEPKPIIPEPKEEPAVVEKPRAEKFDVVEGQKNVELKKFHVVIGSFGNKNNALRLQAKMRPEYNPILVINEKGMFRVLLVSYDTYKEARDKIREVKDQFFDAWVLIQKQN